MAQNKKQRINGDFSEYILLVFRKEGALTLGEIQEKTALVCLNFNNHRSHRRKDKEQTDVPSTCEGMRCKNLLHLTEDAKYELTEEGKAKAELTAQTMERGAEMLQNQFLSPTAAARNCTASYIFVAALKMVAGLLSGSVGLLADGADTTVDTAASAIVWFGMKFKREILGTITILSLMFLTAGLLFYDSGVSIFENMQGTFVPMTMPYMVIAVELIAMLSMFVVSFYQRFVGKRSQSLALISQSIDSKNSVYSSVAVVIGAVFSIFGVHWVDAVVGAFIAVRISLDGIDLTREVAKTMRGEMPEFSKYKMPFEKQIGERRMEGFRNWVLYSIHEDKASTKEQIVASLEKTFRPNYMPAIFTEFTTGRFDFQGNFFDIINPLIQEEYLLEADGKYVLTTRGRAYIKGTISSQRYKQTEL